MKRVRVRHRLVSGELLCSDGRLRRQTGNYPVAAGAEVWADGPWVLGHRWRKVRSEGAAHPTTAEAPLPCPDGYVLLLLRSSGGARRYFCLSLADGAVQELQGLGDPRLAEDLRTALVDVEADLGITPPASSRFHVHEVDEAIYFLLGEPFERAFSYYVVRQNGGIITWEVDGVSERRPYRRETTAGGSPPWPDVHLLTPVAWQPVIGQSQDFHLQATAIDDVVFGEDRIDIVRSGFRVAKVVNAEGLDSVIYLNQAAWERYDYEGGLLDQRDLEDLVKSYFTGYPHAVAGSEDQVWQIAAVWPHEEGLRLRIVESRQLGWFAPADGHRLVWPGGSEPLQYLDAQTHNTGAYDGSFAFAVTDDLALSGTRSLSYEDTTIGGVSVRVYTVADSVALAFHETSASIQGTARAADVYGPPRLPVGAAMTPLDWLAEDGHTVLVYSRTRAVRYQYGAEASNGRQYLWTRHTTENSFWLQLDGTPLPLEAAGEVATADDDTTAYLLERHNQARADAGLGPLAADRGLERMAGFHAADLALNGIYSHTGSGGDTLADRIEQWGIECEESGENLGLSAGATLTQGELADLFDSWMASPAERSQILQADFTRIGIGCDYDKVNSRWVFTVDFADGAMQSPILSEYRITFSRYDEGEDQERSDGWSAEGEEVRDVSLALRGGKLLVSYLVQEVTKPEPSVDAHGYVEADSAFEEQPVARVFAFYDVGTGELLWRGTIATVGLERLTAGFLEPD